MPGPADLPGSRRRLAPYLLGAWLVGLTIYLVFRGWDFYRLSLEDRVEHPEFRTLRSSGMVGNGYGWVAALLMVMNLSYLVRRLIGNERLGSMKTWLDIHVFTGLTAAMFASFHSTFILRTPLASATSFSLLIVVVTGLIGRYLHALVPATTTDQLERLYTEADAEVADFSASVRDLVRANPAPSIDATAGLLTSVIAFARARRVGAGRKASLRALAGAVDPGTSSWRRCQRRLGAVLAADARRPATLALMRSWRSLHRFFALVMLAAVLFHAYVAWKYGYRWIFE